MTQQNKKPPKWLEVLIWIIAVLVGTALFLYKAISTEKYKSANPQNDSTPKSNISTIDKMSGEQFENVLVTYFRSQGVRVEKTARTGDYGADLIITTKSGERWAAQAKRYSQKVGVDAV